MQANVLYILIDSTEHNAGFHYKTIRTYLMMHLKRKRDFFQSLTKQLFSNKKTILNRDGFRRKVKTQLPFNNRTNNLTKTPPRYKPQHVS